MDYSTQQHDYSQNDTWARSYTPSSPATRLDGLPTCSEDLVPLQSQGMDRPSSYSLPQFKEKNPVRTENVSPLTKIKRIKTDGKLFQSIVPVWYKGYFGDNWCKNLVKIKKEKDSRSYTSSVIRKRPHTEKLLKSLAKLFEEHMKEEYKGGFSESPEIKSWVENIKFSRDIICNDEDEYQGLTERESFISLEFKYKSYE